MKNILYAFIVLGFISLNTKLNAQNLNATDLETFKKLESSLIPAVDSMNRVIINAERIEYCHQFVKKLSAVLKEKNSFYYPFDTLAKKVHIIYQEDKSFRIFNWPVEYATARFRYYGAIQMANGTIYPLIDQSDNLDDQKMTKMLDNHNWFGVEIYRILTQKDANGQSVYFIFGANHNNQNTSVKTIDVLSFEGKNAILGGDYFNVNAKKSARFILEYQKGAQVSLNYDSLKGMVVFNDLESEVNQPQRKNTLVPSGQMNGLKWNNNQWVLVKDIVPILKLQNGQAPINGVFPTQ